MIGYVNSRSSITTQHCLLFVYSSFLFLYLPCAFLEIHHIEMRIIVCIRLLLCASLLLLSTLAKPSYTFVLIPGCCAFAAWQALRANRVDWIYLIFGICIPGC